ncbi:MAG: PH domain-containing protein [Gammaproteobacteria bacterium]|nr:PH domain-containing protein [Gammaproteobacteria bacterium]MDE0177919.1 PH domain-containing protein [Gammaproteobacteria bacterium]MDE0442247.1 PH domain-containing protein [Gammaproteobacteria bacterium]
MFVNPEIPIDALPSADAVEWHPLDPRFVRCRQARNIVRTLILFAIVGIAHAVVANVPKLGDIGWLFPWLWALAVVRFAWAVFWPVVDIPRRGYAVRDKDILYKAGVFWRSVTAVPYNRVQHAETGNAPMERRFGLARLTVFTAGTTGGDLRIEGLDETTAERLRVFVVGKVRGEDSEAPAADAEETAGVGLSA